MNLFLEENESKAARERLTLVRLYEELCGLGFEGSYAAVRRYTIAWREKRVSATADAFVPLTFAPGEAYQFDWSHDIVVMDGVTRHVRLTIKAQPRSYTAAMPTARDPLYQRHRFPPEVISHAVWLYFRFPLSLRMVEEMLAARGICVTYETVRQWGKKFGKAFADQIRQRAPARGDKWHMDEVVISIAGEPHWLWRAVDQNGIVLDVLVQRRRDTRAAQRLIRKLLKSAVTPPRVMITDKLRSYGAARAKMDLQVEHRQHKGLNNRAENLINRPGGANGS